MSIFFYLCRHTKFSKMNNISTRKSIRKYTNQDVSDDLLNHLLNLAERTPTMGNLQLYSVIVTRRKEMKQKLAPAHFNQPMVTEAPVVLTFCADFRRTTIWARQRQAQPGYDNFLSFINAASDTLLYTQTFCNLAEEEGLGTCYLGTTVYQPEQIIETLQLPRLVFPIATITLGWPDEDPALTDRLPLHGIVHNETYHDYDAEAINDIYAQKEALPENKQFVEINHKQTLAQIFTDIRYTEKDNLAMSEGMIRALRRQGFLK